MDARSCGASATPRRARTRAVANGMPSSPRPSVDRETRASRKYRPGPCDPVTYECTVSFEKLGTGNRPSLARTARANASVTSPLPSTSSGSRPAGNLAATSSGATCHVAKRRSRTVTHRITPLLRPGLAQRIADVPAVPRARETRAFPSAPKRSLAGARSPAFYGELLAQLFARLRESESFQVIGHYGGMQVDTLPNWPTNVS